MLFSYQQAVDVTTLPAHTRSFASAATQLNTPQGLILSSQAYKQFLSGYGLQTEVQSLLDAITDDESVTRVENEVRRRIVTGRIDKDTAEHISEAQEILSMDEQLNISDIPLVAVLSTDHDIGEMPVILNIVGKKALADAIRTLWSRSFKYPYPNGIPECAIILYRMPPLLSTAHVRIDEDIVVEAVQGWGRFVQASEVADVFTFDLQAQLHKKDIRNQDSMVHRNPRTGEMVKTSPKQADAQALTDSVAESLARNTRRVSVSSAYYGVSESSHWLLSVGKAAVLTSGSEPQSSLQEAEEVVDEVVEESAPEEEVAIEIVELDEEPEIEDSEPEVIIEQPEPVKEFDDPLDSGEIVLDDSSDMISKLSEQLLVAIHQDIERILRDWLRTDGPDAYADLIHAVSSRRVVPYKSRLLTLDEMRQQGAFSDPSPEAVRFGLETLQRFKREF